MVVGLDGIEKIVLALNPTTLEETPYTCKGYMNTGTFQKGRLVEVYGPVTKGGTSYTLDELKYVAAQNNYTMKSYVRAPDVPPFEPPKFFASKRIM
jgi:hypothetical protein